MALKPAHCSHGGCVVDAHLAKLASTPLEPTLRRKPGFRDPFANAKLSNIVFDNPQDIATTDRVDAVKTDNNRLLQAAELGEGVLRFQLLPKTFANKWPSL